jgi:hypothetical protein
MAIVLVVLFLTRPKHHTVGPFQTSFWYWQTPYTLSKDDQTSLNSIGVKQVFVRGGTFSSDGTNVVLLFPQKFTEGASTFPIHLVFNADAGVLHHFEDYNLGTITPQISERILRQVQQAQKQGAKVAGVQLDFDVSTRLLPKYADLVKRIRESNPLFRRHKDFQFSITGLMTWLGTSGVETLSSEVDFMVPQAYEGITGRSPDEMRPVFDPDDLKRRLPQAERLNCPYWIGIPAYGHALLYDENDRLVGTYRTLEAQDALRHPSFKLVDAFPSGADGKPSKGKDWFGEEILKFKAIKPAASGYGLGFTLAYSLPSPKLLSLAKSLIEQSRGLSCLGVVIYRMPEAASSFTIPLTAIRQSLSGKDPVPEIKLELSSQPVAFEAIENATSTIPLDTYLEVTNVGTGNSFVSPDALDIRLEFDKPGFGEVRLRDFDGIKFCSNSSSTYEEPCEPKKASIIHLTKGFFYTGQKIYCGPVRLLNSGKVSVKINSRIRLQSGVSWQESPTREALISSGAGNQR